MSKTHALWSKRKTLDRPSYWKIGRKRPAAGSLREPAGETPGMLYAKRLTQEQIVLVLSAAPLLAFSRFLPPLASAAATATLVRDVPVLVIPSVTTALEVIGRVSELLFGACRAIVF